MVSQLNQGISVSSVASLGFEGNPSSFVRAAVFSKISHLGHIRALLKFNTAFFRPLTQLYVMTVVSRSLEVMSIN